MKFEFATAGRILFGPGILREAVPTMAGFGRKALVATGRSPERAGPLLEWLKAAGVETSTFAVAGEPTVGLAEEGVARAREAGAEMVISLGGGSVIDAGKAIAALVKNPGEVMDYLEVIGGGRPLTSPPIPFVAVPTTAGTGAEVTRNAVLGSPDHRVKVSLRSPLMLPRLAIVDPELTRDLPPELTATTGMDALTQLIEPFLSCKANPMTDALCREGISLAANALPGAWRGEDAAAREAMALASLFGGLALANAALGAVHGFAGPLGGMYSAPHGAICAALLPNVMEINLRAVRARGEQRLLDRFDEIAVRLTGQSGAKAADGVAWIREMTESMGIPPLSQWGMSAEEAEVVVEKAEAASSMKGNPLPLTRDELREIFARSL